MAIDQYGIDWQAVDELEVTGEERRAIIRSPISGGVVTAETINAWRANAWQRDIIREAMRIAFVRSKREESCRHKAFREEFRRLHAEHRNKIETLH